MLRHAPRERPVGSSSVFHGLFGLLEINVKSYLGICHFSWHPPGWPCKHPSANRSASKPSPWLLLKTSSTKCCAPWGNGLVYRAPGPLNGQTLPQNPKELLGLLARSVQPASGHSWSNSEEITGEPPASSPSTGVHGGIASIAQGGAGFSALPSLFFPIMNLTAK